MSCGHKTVFLQHAFEGLHKNIAKALYLFHRHIMRELPMDLHINKV